MNNLYEQKVERLNNMMVEETLETNLTEDEKQLALTVEDILDSDTLYLEDADTGKALVLQDTVNGRIFEAVAEASYTTLTDIYENALEEGPEEEDDDDEDDEDVESADEDYFDEQEEGPEEDEDEDEEEDEDEDDEEEEPKEEDFDSEEERDAVMESILNLINSENYIIRNDPENNGLVISEDAETYETIRAALIERLIDIAESDEEIEFVEEIVKEYNELFMEDAGYGLASIEQEELTEGKRMDYLKGKAGASKEAVKKFLKTKKGKAALIGTGALATGIAAYKGRKQIAKAGKYVKGKAISAKQSVQQKIAARKERKRLAADYIPDTDTMTEEEAAKMGLVKRARQKIAGAPKATKELIKKAWGKGKLGKAGVIAGGAAVAGGAGYGAYKLAKRLKKKRAQKEAVNNHQSAGELLESRQELDEVFGKVAQKVAKYGKKASKIAAKAKGKMKITQAKTALRKAKDVAKYGKGPMGLVRKHKVLTGLGAGALGVGALQARKERKRTQATKRGIAMANEEVVDEGIGAALKYGGGALVGAAIGKKIAKKIGKGERKAMITGPDAYSKDVMKGFKKTMKGKKKAEKSKVKFQSKLAKIRGKYNK